MTIELTAGGTAAEVDLGFTADDFSYTVTADNAVESLRLEAMSPAGGSVVGVYTVDYEVEYEYILPDGTTVSGEGGEATVGPVPVGGTEITVTVTQTVTVTDDSAPPQTRERDYSVDVTRPADTTLSSLAIEAIDGRFLDDDGKTTPDGLDPKFDSATYSYRGHRNQGHDGGDGYGRADQPDGGRNNVG